MNGLDGREFMACYYKDKRVLYLILPDYNEELNKCALSCAHYFATKWDYDKICVVACDDRINSHIKMIDGLKVAINFKTKKDMNRKMRLFSKRADAMGRCIYENVRIFTIEYYNKELKKIVENGIMDWKAIVCRRMYCTQNKYIDLSQIP